MQASLRGAVFRLDEAGHYLGSHPDTTSLSFHFVIYRAKEHPRLVCRHTEGLLRAY
jgi:hypothetical protein